MLFITVQGAFYPNAVRVKSSILKRYKEVKDVMGAGLHTLGFSYESVCLETNSRLLKCLASTQSRPKCSISVTPKLRINARFTTQVVSSPTYEHSIMLNDVTLKTTRPNRG